MMEAALTAGFRDARIIVNLAFTTAILDGVDSAKTALGDIAGDQGWISWREAMELVGDTDRQDTALLGFSLGVDESGILTRLGTFARTFLDDNELAESLYRAATRANPHDAVAQTNLARFLVRTGGSLTEAERAIQRAQTFADRRFTWWRPVLAEITALKSGGDTSSIPTLKAELPPIPSRFTSLQAIKKRYLSIAGLQDAQKRGYELERVFYGLAAITFGTAAPSYRFEREFDAKSQVDGYFEHRGDKYRVECKWTVDPIDHRAILEFKDKLDVVGVSGLFVSMSGFTDSAIARAREARKEHAIILMCGEEVDAVFREHISFDELINRKRLQFDRNSLPFYLVTPTIR